MSEVFSGQSVTPVAEQLDAVRFNSLLVVHGALEQLVEQKQAAERYRDSGFISRASELHPEENQDAVLCEPTLGLFAVFDGLGGHMGGEWASHYAALRTKSMVTKLRLGASAIKIPDVRSMIDQINTEMFVHGKGTQGFTTATIAIERTVQPKGRKELLIANVGDTRAYVHRGGELFPMTLDNNTHNTISHPIALDEDDISIPDLYRTQRILAELDNVDSLPNDSWDSFYIRNAFNNRRYARSIGVYHKMPKPAVTRIKTLPGDTIILTSDGVHDNLKDSEIAGILLQEKDAPAEQVSEKLVESATIVSRLFYDNQNTSQRPKPDDMSAVVVRY